MTPGVVLYGLITIVFQFLWWAILIKVLLSWLPMAGIRIDPYNPAIQALNAVTNPILEPLRPYFTISMMDFSPIVALIGLGMIEQLLKSLIV